MKVAGILLFACFIAFVLSQSIPFESCPLSKADNEESRMHEMKLKKIELRESCRAAGECPKVAPALSNIPCVNGMADEYPCEGYDLQSFVPLQELHGGASKYGEGNDIWGWTDPVTGNEYAIFCATDGTSFVDVTFPTSPLVLTFLPTETTNTIWRDAKVYMNYAYIVSESINHGMQVFDLTVLRYQTEWNPALATQGLVTVYDGFGSAHNIVINEETGFAYAVGTKTCNGGLHIVDLSDPADPQFAACFSTDGYVHDAQCVYYTGPDTRYHNKEICICYDEDTVTIVDVTDKSDDGNNMVILSRTCYEDNYYTHQGWLTANQRYGISNDELDEYETNKKHTRSLIWDFADLENPILLGAFFSPEEAIDHNLYVLGNLVFESNYCAGLRVLDASNIANGELTQVGYFDVAPDCSIAEFFGSWSNYPYFKSGNIVVTSIERGLFVVKQSSSN